jgi:acetylornithine/succinyldiaminopimelate/putrescine aminotransferase
MSEATRIFSDYLAQTTPSPIGIEVASAERCVITAASGKTYLDMISGIAVNNLGHRHPEVVNAIKQQADRYLHVMVYGEYVQEPLNTLALELQSLLPVSLNNYYYVNSGTEANEAALKLAKRATGRTEIISMRGSYHGSTHGSLSVSGNEKKKYAFRPLLPGVKFIRFNKLEDLSSITQNTAAVITETVQGDAGVRIPDLCYMQALRKRCDETCTLLIIDEIQTGFYRTGTAFAFEKYGIVPDILTMGKAIAGGLPMGCLAASKELMHLFTHNPMLGHITTFGGNPLICAAAHANIRALKKEVSPKEIERKGALLEGLLNHPKVKEIRRAGLMFAIDLSSFEEVKQVVDYCLEQGVLTFWFLSTDYAFRLAPPLIISDKELEQAAGIIQEGLSRIS